MKARTVILWSNVALSGGWFGVLQWCAFFLLQSYLASTAIVYLLATSVWLVGSVAGLVWGGRGRERTWIATAVAGYYGLRALAVAHPYDMRWLPLLLVGVAVMGAYAGRFFRCRQQANPKWLFFVENTGFVAGIIVTAVALFLWGDVFLLVAPGALGAACWLSAAAGNRRNSGGPPQKLRAAV